MALDPWPAELPQTLFLDSGLALPDNVVHASDVGGGKTRMRSTLGTQGIRGRIVLDGTQAVRLRSFYDGDLGGGSLPFVWAHPITGVDMQMQFSPGTPPELIVIVGNADPSLVLWAGVLALRVLRVDA